MDTAVSILEAVQDINRQLGITVLVVTHQIDLVGSICTREVSIRNGVLTQAPHFEPGVSRHEGKAAFAATPRGGY